MSQLTPRHETESREYRAGIRRRQVRMERTPNAIASVG